VHGWIAEIRRLKAWELSEHGGQDSESNNAPMTLLIGRVSQWDARSHTVLSSKVLDRRARHGGLQRCPAGRQRRRSACKTRLRTPGS